MKQSQLEVVLCSLKENNGNHNWAAMFRRVEPFDGLQGSLGDITITCSKNWNRVAYAAERARVLLGERQSEPSILEYGQDVETPEQWQGQDPESLLNPMARQEAYPELKVRLTSFPETNGKRNWTALILRVEPFDKLIGNCGGITVDRGEYWNRVAYEAECARFLLGERQSEPDILEYGEDVKTPQEWTGNDPEGIYKEASQ